MGQASHTARPLKGITSFRSQFYIVTISIDSTLIARLEPLGHGMILKSCYKRLNAGQGTTVLQTMRTTVRMVDQNNLVVGVGVVAVRGQARSKTKSEYLLWA